MGPIQASLNQLSGSIIGGIRNMAIFGRGVKEMQKGKAQEEAKVEGKKPESETANVEPQLLSPRLRGVSPRLSKKFKPGDVAAMSGNDMIYQKARTRFDVATRLSMLADDEGGEE